MSAVVVCLLLTGLLIAQEQAKTDQQPVEKRQDTEIIAGIEPMGDLTILELLKKGGPVMYPLYLCSIIMVAFGIERAVSLRTKRVLPADIVEKIRSVTSKEPGNLDSQKLLNEIQAYENPIARVVKAGLRKADRPVPEIEKAIEDAGEKEAGLMRRNCRVLSIVASISPLLGLLGTVLGMIRAFMTVAAREEALGRTELLASGIYQALVTTAAGLTIAIPALVLYYIYVEKVERLVSEMDDITIDLVEKMSARA